MMGPDSAIAAAKGRGAGAGAQRGATADQLRSALLEEQAQAYFNVSAPSNRADIVGTAATLCNSVVGVGILSLPRAIANIGLVPGIVLLLLTATMSLLTLELLAECARGYKASTYAVLVRDAIGWLPSKLSASAVTVNLFGACVGANIAMAGALDDLLVNVEADICGDGRYNGSESLVLQCLDPWRPPEWMILENRQLWVVLLGTLLALPLSLHGSYRALRPASILSTIAVIVLACVVLWLGLQKWMRGETLKCKGCPDYDAAVWSSGFLDSASVFMFAFVTHSISPKVLSEMADPSPAMQTAALRLTIAFVTVIYLVVGVMGYMLFSSDVCDSIAASFEIVRVNSTDISRPAGANGTELILVHLLIILSLGAGFPTVLWPCRDAVAYVMMGAPPPPPEPSGESGDESVGDKGTEATAHAQADHQRDMWRRGHIGTGISIGLWVGSIVTAMFIEDATDVLEIVGACVSSVIAFVLPFACYTSLHYGQSTLSRRMRSVPGICAMLGACLACVATVSVMRNLGWLAPLGWREQPYGADGSCARRSQPTPS